MRRKRGLRALVRQLRSGAGFTLIELLVATALGLMVLFVIYGFATIAQKSQAQTGDRADSLAEQRAALERMTRELRQATTVNVSTPELVTFQVYGASGGSLREIRYDCRTDARCRRYEGPPGGLLSKTHDALVSSLQGVTFTALTLGASQDYVTVEIRVSLPGRSQPIVLSDGVHLRNKGL